MNTSALSGLARGDKTLLFLYVVAVAASVVFWMYVGWRAMRAHEQIADTVEKFRRQQLAATEKRPS